MPISDKEYREILEGLRRTMRQVGLGSMDERILSEILVSQEPFYDLSIYLKLLISELSLGSEEQLRIVLTRAQRAARTEAGDPIHGFRVGLSPAETRVYKADFLDLAPIPVTNEVVSDLRAILEELYIDWQNRPRGR